MPCDSEVTELSCALKKEKVTQPRNVKLRYFVRFSIYIQKPPLFFSVLKRLKIFTLPTKISVLLIIFAESVNTMYVNCVSCGAVILATAAACGACGHQMSGGEFCVRVCVCVCLFVCLPFFKPEKEISGWFKDDEVYECGERKRKLEIKM